MNSFTNVLSLDPYSSLRRYWIARWMGCARSERDGVFSNPYITKSVYNHEGYRQKYGEMAMSSVHCHQQAAFFFLKPYCGS